MSKQHDSGTVLVKNLALQRKIKQWDYDESVAKMRPLMRKWKHETEAILRELYLAKEYLTTQKGQQRDPEADGYIIHSWSGYCGELGLSYQTANNWLRPFTPRELSDTGKDVLLLEPPLKEDTTASRALLEARIMEVMRTGKRPSDWTDREEIELKKRMENARLAKLADELNTPAVERTKTDYFAAALKRSKDIVNFKLENREQILAQAAIFDHIEAYLKTFKDPEIKARAAFNIALKTRNFANEIAELNFQLSEAEPPREEEHDR